MTTNPYTGLTYDDCPPLPFGQILPKGYFPGGVDYWTGPHWAAPSVIAGDLRCPHCGTAFKVRSKLGWRRDRQKHHGLASCDACKKTFAWGRIGGNYSANLVRQPWLCPCEGHTNVFYRRERARRLRLYPQERERNYRRDEFGSVIREPSGNPRLSPAEKGKTMLIVIGKNGRAREVWR